MHQAHDSRHESPEGFCIIPNCDYRPYSESDMIAVLRRLSNIDNKVTELHEIVMNLVKGIGEAQQSGGMAGMMARQLPDMRQMVKFDEVV